MMRSISTIMILFSLAGVAWSDATGPWPVARDSIAAQPHPAVVRIMATEQGGMSFGSGTLVDSREGFGLVVTNWHVVRDATGPIEVIFPDGFHSFARPLKIDRDWDLAALVIWKPPVDPVPIAQRPPQPGEPLMIAGYGQGVYRAAAGRCTQYLAPKVQMPQEMVEVSVEARQGDSGGPIFNAQGELAGVLFGASYGTTMGSFAGRVRGFLASVAPELAGPNAALLAQSPPTATASLATDLTTPTTGTEVVAAAPQPPATDPFLASDDAPAAALTDVKPSERFADIADIAEPEQESLATAAPPERPEFDPVVPPHRLGELSTTPEAQPRYASVPGEFSVPQPAVAAIGPSGSDSNRSSSDNSITWEDIAGETLAEQVKSVLAAIGGLAVVIIAMRGMRKGS